MKKVLGLSLLTWLLFLSGCAITHEYGPYMGKVVEKETGAPIEGAVVFMSFYTKEPSLGGPVTYFADATEILTDAEGQFIIPLQSIWSMKPLHYWDPQPLAIIFKPGYGAFPGYSGTTISPRDGKWFPDNKQITVQLPKLNTKEERRENLFAAGRWDRHSPCEKQRVMLGLYNSERILMGFEPVMTNICGDTQNEK